MYNRTQNDNGTFNTMCLDCLHTIATSVENQTDVELLELHHVCPEKALAQMLSMRNESELQVKRH
jgi:hypothetical protein